MLFNFDEETQKIIQMAKKEMYDLKHPYVGSEHFLLAILKNKDLSICNFFYDNYKINYDIFRKEIIKIIGMGSTSNKWFLFTPLFKKVISNSILISHDNNEEFVTIQRLFSCLLDEGEGVAIRLLIGMGVDYKDLVSKFKDSSYIINSSNKNLEIDKFADNLNLKNKSSCTFGRDDIIDRIISIFLRKTKSNPMLIGDAGVGKTAIVEELAYRISINNVPEFLKGKRILSLSTASLVAGTKYRGEFEERINKYISEIEHNNDIILFIDEIHTLMGAGGADGAIDASNILKPYLARGKIKLIGATTNAEYLKYIANDKAFDRRFQKIYVSEPNKDKTVEILRSLKNDYEKFHKVVISNELINLIVTLSNRFIKNSHQPDKAIDLLDEACCLTYLCENKTDKKIKELKSKIHSLNIKKNDLIINNDYKNAVNLNFEEKQLISKLNNIYFLQKKSELKEVTAESIYKVIYYKTNIPLSTLLNFNSDYYKKNIKLHIFGHDEEINKIFSYLTFKDILTRNCNYSFMLYGSNGVGKRKFVNEFATSIFGKDNFFVLNFSELSDSQSISRIIGSAPGYVGYNDNKTFLDKIKFHPFSVVLIENLNLSNKRILNLFIDGIKEGFITNSIGEKVDVSNIIFFFTCDLKIKNKNIGFVNGEFDEFNLLSKYFDVELLKSFDLVLNFKDILKKDVLKIIKSKLLSYDFDNKSINDKVLNSIFLTLDYDKYGLTFIDKQVNNYINNNIFQ